jgi:prophage regulatory protein
MEPFHDPEQEASMQAIEQAAQSESGFMRLYQIIGDKKRGIVPLLPISSATWWRGCRSGKFPKPIKLSQNVTAWRRSEVLALVNGGAE